MAMLYQIWKEDDEGNAVLMFDNLDEFKAFYIKNSLKDTFTSIWIQLKMF